MASSKRRGQLMLLGSMLIFGTIGIFVRHIALPSSLIAQIRGICGSVFLLLVMLVKKERLDRSAIRRNFWVLLLSGTFLGANWIALFEAYRYTTVATATLCYYLAPILVMLVSPFLLKEKLTGRKVITIALALLGMVLVSGVGAEDFDASQLTGVGLGLLAAALYAAVVIANRKLTEIGALDTTVVQLTVSAVVLLPYNLLTVDASQLNFGGMTPALLALVGIVHTGVAYWLYFGSVRHLSAQTAALLSYIDPITAVVLSALVLSEPMTVPGIIGAVLVLGATAADLKE